MSKHIPDLEQCSIIFGFGCNPEKFIISRGWPKILACVRLCDKNMLSLLP